MGIFRFLASLFLLLLSSASFAVDTDGDGLPDYWEEANGLDPTNSLDARLDHDNDCIENLQEYNINGSQPIANSPIDLPDSFPSNLNFGVFENFHLNLITPMLGCNGKIYYFLDASNNGSAGSIWGGGGWIERDDIHHDWLDNLFNNGNDTTDNEREVWLDTYKLKLPTFDELSEIAPYARLKFNGVWPGGQYWTSTSSGSNTHVRINLMGNNPIYIEANASDTLASMVTGNVILEVIHDNLYQYLVDTDNDGLTASVDISIIEESGFDQVIYTAQANKPAVTYRIESKLAIQYAHTFDIKIQPTFRNDPENDDFYIMQLSLSESAINSMLPLANSDAKSIESFELTIGFDPDDIDIDSVNYIGPDFDSTFNVSNSELLGDNSGITLSQILIGPSMPVTSSTVIGSVKFKLKEGVDSAQFDINRFLINSELDNKTSSSVTLLTNLESDLLTINENTGAVSLAVVDYETHAQYGFEVVATDVVENSSDKQAVIVRVIDVAEVAPEITSDDEVPAINENSGNSQVVYDAEANTPMATFRLAEGSDPALSINELTGVVTLANNPDFEVQSEYDFSVIASTSLGDSDPLVLTLETINLDETAPIFSESAAIAITINDYIAAGEVIYTAIATDSADVSDGFTFNLLGDNASEFSISNNEATFGQLVLNNQLAVGQYSFEVVATDAAGNVSDAQTISLTVDSSVVITSPSYAGAIDENFAAGQLVYTVTSSKEDVTYALTQDSDSDLGIDASTGEVTLLVSPDYEVKNQHNFTVIATSIESGTAELPVTLSINNLDEVGPTITSGSDAGSVVEGSSLEVVYTATADDSGDISDGVIFILSGDDAASFTINYLTGAVTFVGDADFYVQPIYNFKITAFDAADNASVPVQVMLSVTPLEITSGDTAIFTPEEREEPEEIETVISIPDQAVNTQHVYVSDSQLSADGSQVTVTYSYKSDYSNTTGVGFSVGFDSSTLAFNSATATAPDAFVAGVLKVDGTDFVDFSFVSIFGSFPRSNEVVLGTITFDIDSSASYYTQLDTVGYNNHLGMEYDVQSQLISLGSFSRQEIYQTGANLDSATFSLVDNTVYPIITESIITVPNQAPNTQHIYVSESARSEDGAQITVKLSYLADDPTLDGVGFDLNFDSSVLSFDSVSVVAGAPFASGSLDSDGNALVFAFYDPFGGSWPGSTGAELATVTFDVVDTQFHATKLYISPTYIPTGLNFEGQSHEALNTGVAQPSQLSIDENTGSVTFLGDVDPYLNYSFTVTVRNGDQTVSQDVFVTVEDSDAPIITSADSAVAIDENSGEGQMIYTAEAEDLTVVTYTLAGVDANKFEIDSASGKVTLIADPDYEAQSEYSFDVIATDSSGNVSDPKTVTLAINNLDEIAPSITSADTPISIDENIGAEQVVYTAIADDSTDISAGVIFSLSDDSDPALSINAVTGEVTLADDPNFEPVNAYSDAKTEYTFAVIATDAAGNASTAQAMTLNINNIDDAPPTITSGGAANSIYSLSGGGQVIYTATAYDSDDISDGVTFEIVEKVDENGIPIDDWPDFEIFDPSSGEIILVYNPNYAIKNEYSFSVIAKDAAGNISEAQSVTLKVDDLAPFPASVSFTENTGLADDNISSNGELTVSGLKFGAQWEYSTNNGLSWNPGSASADSGTATITALEDGDYQVIVRQTNNSIDSQTGERRSSASEMVEFIVDNTAPSITSGNLVTAIDENTGAGQVVYTATANDSSEINGISFSLEEGSDPDLSIDAITSAVTLETDPDFETWSEYSFSVIATDIAGNSSESQPMSFSINDITSYVFINPHTGEEITNVDIIDPANGIFSKELNYFERKNAVNSADALVILSFVVGLLANEIIIDDELLFDISDVSNNNAVTSADALTLMRALVDPNDSLDFKNYHFEFSYAEGDTEYFFAYITGDVNFNANEEVFVITSSDYIFLDPSTDVGSVIYNPEVNFETNISGNLSYSLVSDPLSQVSMLDQNTGQIILAKSIEGDLEEFSFEIAVSKQEKTTNQKVTVKLQKPELLFDTPESIDISKSDSYAGFYAVNAMHAVEKNEQGPIVQTVTYDSSGYVDLKLNFNPDYNYHSEIYSLDFVVKYSSDISLNIEHINDNFDSLFLIWNADNYGEIKFSIIKSHPIIIYSEGVFLANSNEIVNIRFNISDDVADFIRFETSELIIGKESDSLFVSEILPGKSISKFMPNISMDGLSYTLEDENIPFDINSDTGEITPSDNFFWTDNQSSYSLTVGVDNEAGDREQTLLINIQNANIEPEFICNTISSDSGYSMLDFDSNGEVDALTDGLILLRYSFGLRGAALTNEAIADNSLSSFTQVERQVECSYPGLDLDTNGSVDPLTDGLLLLRYLFGLRGQNLIDGVISQDANRTQAADIEAYIETLLP